MKVKVVILSIISSFLEFLFFYFLMIIIFFSILKSAYTINAIVYQNAMYTTYGIYIQYIRMLVSVPGDVF